MVVLVGLTSDRGAGERSDLTRIKKWWRGLGGEGFVALPPPTRSRYTQSDGHEDAAELFAARGITGRASFAYWHWQSHAAFDRTGALRGRLYLHWGGDHATVAAGLGAGPEGYRLVDNGPQAAFELDRVTATDPDGLPDPRDEAGVRQFLDRIGADRHGRHASPLTGPEERWLHDRLAGPVEPVAATGPSAATDPVTATDRFATALELRQALTPEEASRLLAAGQEEHAGRLSAWRGWWPVLNALLRQGREEAWELAAALGPAPADTLAEHPSPRALAALRALVLAGHDGAVPAWFRTYRTLHEPDPYAAARALCAELPDRETAPAALLGAVRTAVTEEWRAAHPDADPETARSAAALTAVRLTTDDRLPRPLRVAAARAAYDQVAHVRERAARTPGPEAAEALAAADRYEAVRDELLAGTGPDLTTYEGALGDLWHRYRTLSPADTGWLRDRVADPATGVQGIAFCLELLYAHGAAGEAEVRALLPRWKKELAKQYRTTYTEWRHPLVTLTCLAQDLGHPAADELLAWWARPKPLWKDPLRLLTHLGAPDEAKAAELWESVVSGAHDTGHLMTWVLLRARLDGAHPLHVAEKLTGEPGIRPYVLHRVLIGVADPAQPLWHYAMDPRSHGWWHRAQEVADNPTLSAEARAIGMKAAREHYVTRYPDQVRPPLAEGEVNAARAWLEARADRTAAD
ncbi:serine/threonine-protein kinase [Streptomyces bacillaris]|uniref:hypothetical protein n=1 Tax=Streptomyces bacillaris TaxID=68179 RepID=UPI0036698268